MNIKCLLVFAFAALFLAASRNLRADTPDAGNFASFGVQWTPPTAAKYEWPIVQGYVAFYNFSGASDKSTASLRVEMAPADKKSLADIANEFIKKSQGALLSTGPKIGGDPSSRIIGPATAAGFHAQTLYVVVHDDFKYVFSSLTSGTPGDTAATAANAALETILPTVKFAKPVSPVTDIDEQFLPAFRYEGDLMIRLPSAMRVVHSARPLLFILRDYATNADVLNLGVTTLKNAGVTPQDLPFQTRIVSNLKHALKCDEDPSLTIALHEPQLLFTQPLHGVIDLKSGTRRQTFQSAMAFLSNDRQAQIACFINPVGDDETAYLKLVTCILDSLRVSAPPPPLKSSAAFTPLQARP